MCSKLLLLAAPTLRPLASPRPCYLPSTVTSCQKRQLGIRSIEHFKPNHFNEKPGLPALLTTKKAALERRLRANTLPLRTGALATKKGMTAIFDPENGTRIPCTVLQLDRVEVVSHKTFDKHGYFAVCIGSGYRKPKNISKPLLGHFSVQGVSPKRYTREFRVADETGLIAVGEEIKADWFLVGQFVDSRSHCKGKGFAGVMKKWGMKGQSRTHGTSLAHRSMGSAGPSQGGGSRVYPGKKMAGRMGGQRNTVQNLKVLQTDSEKGIVVVHGKLQLVTFSEIDVADASSRCCERPERLSGNVTGCP